MANELLRNFIFPRLWMVKCVLEQLLMMLVSIFSGKLGYYSVQSIHNSQELYQQISNYNNIVCGVKLNRVDIHYIYY